MRRIVITRLARFCYFNTGWCNMRPRRSRNQNCGNPLLTNSKYDGRQHRPQDSLAGIKGTHTSKGREKVQGVKGEEKEGNAWEGRGGDPRVYLHNFLRTAYAKIVEFVGYIRYGPRN